METKDILYELRTKKGLSQEELAEKVFVTRQAVSRWENGETIPNVDTLKLLSQLFDVSINTLLGSPRELICRCCGMPLEDCTTSRETDGNFNEEYCKWCYADGEYTLDIWKRYVEIGGKEKLEEFKEQLICEFNTLLHTNQKKGCAILHTPENYFNRFISRRNSDIAFTRSFLVIFFDC